MNVAIHDADQTGFPNLALMKLSAYHKSIGHDVEWINQMFSYDLIYSSKVFTFTNDDPYLSETAKKGGTGYGEYGSLPDHIEHICPDYDLYGKEFSMGFLTRGCNRKCNWCVVPEKEGKAVGHADVEEFARHRDVVLLDNNVLQSEHGIMQIEKIAKLGLRVDFNQGLDARMIDDSIANLLAKLQWFKPVRLACDHVGMMKFIGKAVERLRWNNVTPTRYFCYVLVKEIDDAVERVRYLKGINVDPFAQPYIDFTGKIKPTAEQKMFARWVNHKAEFKSRTWEAYRDAKNPMNSTGISYSL